jgi:hypothetical protein
MGGRREGQESDRGRQRREKGKIKKMHTWVSKQDILKTYTQLNFDKIVDEITAKGTHRRTMGMKHLKNQADADERLLQMV